MKKLVVLVAGLLSVFRKRKKHKIRKRTRSMKVQIRPRAEYRTGSYSPA